MKIPILYATQTGNSYHIAKIMKNTLEFGYNDSTIYNFENNNHMNTHQFYTISMDHFILEKLFSCKYIIFICSTHGDGDEPFTMKNLWKFLKLPQLDSKSLANLRFAVYGLGDSSYDKFNYASKRLFNRLKMLGANNFLDRGDGDFKDSTGYNSTFKPWVKKLYEYFMCDTEECKTRYDADLESNEFGMFSETKNSSDDSNCFEQQDILYNAVFQQRNLLTDFNYDKKIIEVKFSIKDYNDYFPGDCIGITPENYDINDFLKYMKFKNISNKELNEKEKKLLNNCFTNNSECIKECKSIFELLQKYFNYNFIPDQLIFLKLKNFISNQPEFFEKNVLDFEQVSNKLNEIFQSYDLYYNYILKPKRTFFTVLKEFNIRVNFAFILENVPLIMPRYYTLVKINDYYYIYVSLVQSTGSKNMLKKGLCSEFFKNIEFGKSIYIKISKSSLFFDNEKLLFFITGTGIALPWSVLNYFKDKQITLYYGFRYHNKDRILKSYIQDNTKYNQNEIKLITASSRELDNNYIQNQFENNPVNDIEENLIFICGNVNLNKEFRKIFSKIYNKNIFFQSETW